MQGFLGVKKFTHDETSTTRQRNAGDDEVKRHKEESEKYREWIQAEAEVKYYIMSKIPDCLLIKTINCATSKDLWNAICTEQEWKVKVLRMETNRRIYSERCAEGDDVRAHLAKMVSLREKLEATGETIDDERFASILTTSLPQSYGNVVSIICTIAIATERTPSTQQTIALVETEYARRQNSNGGSPGDSTALRTNPPRPSSSNRGKKRKGPNRCTNPKCRHRHTHEFEDCRSEGGPRHDSNPLQVRKPQNSQNPQNNWDVRQRMRANIMQDATEETFDHVF